MKLTVYSFLPSERNITKVTTILLTCGNSLILVEFCPVLRAQLILSSCVKSVEEADSKKVLEFNNQQYLLLSNDVLEL